MSEQSQNPLIARARTVLHTTRAVSAALAEECSAGRIPFAPDPGDTALALSLLSVHLEHRWCFGTSSHWPLALGRDGAVDRLFSDAIEGSRRFPGEWTEGGPGICLLGGGRDRHLLTAVGAGMRAAAEGLSVPVAVFRADEMCLAPLTEALLAARSQAIPLVFAGLDPIPGIVPWASAMGLPIQHAQGTAAERLATIAETMSPTQPTLLLLPNASDDLLEDAGSPSDRLQLDQAAARAVTAARVASEFPAAVPADGASVFLADSSASSASSAWRRDIDAWDSRGGTP